MKGVGIIKRLLLGIALVLGLLATGLVWTASGYPSALRVPSDRPDALLIENVSLISMRPGMPVLEEDQAILVVDGRIAAVGPTGTLEYSAERDAAALQIIDGAGRTLLPGLIDAHVHVWDEAELSAYLAHGVTTVRNMSGMPFHLSLARRITDGRLLGPHILTTGPILNSPGANQQDHHVLVSTESQAREAVRRQYRQGYRAIKVYSNILPDPYHAILDEAHQLGMSVSGHPAEGQRTFDADRLPQFEIAFEDVLDDGLLTIEHLESIVWHALHDRLDLDAMRALAERIAASDVTVTPTLIAHDNLVRVARSQGEYLDREGDETINPLVRWLDASTREFWSSYDAEPREVPRAEFYREATLILHQANVPLIAGSDAGIFTNLPGRALTRELELLVASGLSPHEALVAATRQPAETFGLDDRGQIAEGFRADLVLVNGDPLSDVTAMEYPDGVMLGGIWLDENDLEEMRNAARQGSVLRTVRHLIVGLASQ